MPNKSTPNDGADLNLTVGVIVTGILITVIGYILFAAYIGSVQIIRNNFELSLLEFIFESIMALPVLGVILLILYGAIHIVSGWFRSSNNAGVIRGMRITLFILLFLWFFGGHYYTSYSLAPLKARFNNIVATENPKLIPRDIGSDYNYGGKLDQIVVERDEYLKSHGYRQLTRWSTNGLSAVYVHVGF
jgi:magnesium-transporting ATPase (P-type)